jgi:hypothetical protein
MSTDRLLDEFAKLFISKKTVREKKPSGYQKLRGAATPMVKRRHKASMDCDTMDLQVSENIIRSVGSSSMVKHNNGPRKTYNKYPFAKNINVQLPVYICCPVISFKQQTKLSSIPTREAVIVGPIMITNEMLNMFSRAVRPWIYTTLAGSMLQIQGPTLYKTDEEKDNLVEKSGVVIEEID